MKTSPARTKSSIRVLWLLIGSFVLTIASFVAAMVLSEYRARGIEAAAEDITTNALPSIACVSRVRTELRQIEKLLERVAGPARWRYPEVELDIENLRHSRDSFTRGWALCYDLPKYPGELSLQDGISARIAEMNASIDIILRAAEQGHEKAALEELTTRTEEAVESVDAAMVGNINLNARHSALLGSEIATIKAESRSTMALLCALSAVLAIAAAMMMVRVVRRYAELMESRISEMELFAGRVAHDVRSPLAAVALALELTKRDPELGIRKGVLERALRTLERIGQLVDGLLVFARAGASPPESVSANVDEILSSVVDEMRPSAEERAITIDVSCASRSALAACTPGVLISIVSNLVGNAIKYMGSAPIRRVSVRTCTTGPSVRVEVSDTGPGVAPDMRERIFDPYVRAAESTIPGIGLGLATVRRLVEAHRGTVGVLPNGEAGSVFWFELPRIEPRTTPQKGDASTESDDDTRERTPINPSGLRPSAPG